MVKVFYLNFQTTKLKPVANLNILINITFRHVPFHYVRYYSFMCVSKERYHSIAKLSKKYMYAGSINFVLKFEWVIAALNFNIDCSSRIECIISACLSDDLRVSFSAIPR